MKRSIFTLMALMATAVCGLTSCSDSDDDYVAPAAAASTVSLAGKTLVGDGGGMTIEFSDETNLVWKEMVNGTDDAQGTYTFDGTQLTMSVQTDPNFPDSAMSYNWTITMTSDSAGAVRDNDNGLTFTFTLQD